MKKKIIFIIVCMLVFSTVAGTISSSKTSTKSSDEVTVGLDYTHTILGEYCTATWCGYCKYAHGALKNLYAGGWHPFYYVSLVTDKNTHAMTRRNEITTTGYPTLVWDGGYKKDVGSGSVPGAMATYNASLVSCGNRAVTDIDLSLDVTWLGPGNPSPEDSATDEDLDVNLSWTNAEMNIDVAIDNNEGSSYDGHLHVYVTEVVSSMGWYDTGGYLYTFPFLDYAFNGDITISAGNTWQYDVDWDGKDHDNGMGEDFGEITQDNTMVIAAIFNNNNDYVDETAGCIAGTDTDPKTFDVYFGDSTPPPKVSSNQSDMEYDPGELEFETTYYWQIVVWDDQGSSTSGSIWSFTTRGNDPPNEPSDPDPEDGETDVYINTDLSWTGGDPDGDDVTYDVYFGKNSPPPKIKSNQSGTSYNPPGVLDFDTTYYWQIVAWDIFNYSSTGSIWSFTTEANTPPNEPSDPDPEDGATDVTIDADLSWIGGDPNPGDTVTYDVYFGTSSPPPLVEEDLTQAAYDPGTMDLNTTYYWQIVAWDSQDLSTTGPIWHFTTELEQNQPPNEPSIDGSTSGKAGEEYDYTFSVIDPNDDVVYYYIEWGDGNIEDWIGSYDSGEEVIISHSWDEQKTYTIRAKAKDSHDAESDWTTLEVTMPKNKQSTNSLFLQFLQNLIQRFPLIERIFSLSPVLNRILNLQ